jgi:crotonobetainyl-CoA:carnitine CoA-transferase CaiB-like acyl-CoA transferase
MVDVVFSLLFDEPLDCYGRLGLDFQQGNRVMRFSPLNTFPTRDGWMVICCGTDAMWRSICDVIGRPDLADDDDWSRMSWRVANNDAVDGLVGEWTRRHDTSDAVARFDAVGVVASPVHTIDDLLRWPHLLARGMVTDVEHPALGVLSGLKAAGFPLKFSEAETGYAGAAAPSGAHNKEILGGVLGLDDAELDDLKAREII